MKKNIILSHAPLGIYSNNNDDEIFYPTEKSKIGFTHGILSMAVTSLTHRPVFILYNINNCYEIYV